MKKSLFLICFLIFKPIVVFAQDGRMSGDVQTRLEVYKAAINLGELTKAKEFLADKEAMSVEATAKGSYTKAQALALKDLGSVMSRDWQESETNILNKILSNYIGKDKVLTRSGIGPEPEKLLPWLKKHIKQYKEGAKAEARIKIVKIAIREWNTIEPDEKINWAQASGRHSVLVSEEIWKKLSLQERNAALIKMGFIQYSDEELAKEEKDNAQLEVITAVTAQGSNILTEEQKQKLNAIHLASSNKKEALAEKAYALNKFFDGSNISRDSELRLKLNSSRQSAPREILDGQDKQLLSSMLQSSVVSEIKSSAVGAKVLADGNLNIKLDYCHGSYSKIDNSGSIVLDLDTIHQFMRLKGYTTSSVLNSKEQVDEIAKYMSPIAVYEAAHLAQNKWAGSKNLYNTRTQETEIDAMSLEAAYTSEKLKNDSSFHNVFTSVEKYSAYAAKRISNASSYVQGKKMFADHVRMNNAELPSLSTMTANTVSIVKEELLRREALSAEERANESYFITYSEVLTMTPEQISTSVGDIEEGALSKLLEVLSSRSMANYYSRSASATRNALPAPKKGFVPAIK